MPEITKFESREAKLSCSAEKFYNFITDLRNFGRFIPRETIREWNAESDSCKFNIASMGEVLLKTAGKAPFTYVLFSGIVLATIKFDLHTKISETDDGRASVKLVMESALPPMIKVFASGPINNFLETLVMEMEKFESWNW
jgi:hypothetical protein